MQTSSSTSNRRIVLALTLTLKRTLMNLCKTTKVGVTRLPQASYLCQRIQSVDCHNGKESRRSISEVYLPASFRSISNS